MAAGRRRRGAGGLRGRGSVPAHVKLGSDDRPTSGSTLWGRLRTHRGTLGGRTPGGGNHRGSIFRLHVGTALIDRDDHPEAASTWGERSSASREVRDREVGLERAVSRHLRDMEVLWLGVASREARAAIERDCIGLLSNHDRAPVDPPSPSWLGHHAASGAVRRSGLWNVNHVTHAPSRDVLVDIRERTEEPRAG